jgi:hypothetical protein
MKSGDTVIRMLAGSIPMELRVQSVTPERVVCGGGWEFDVHTGAEIDDLLDWGPPPKMTGSFLKMKDGKILVTD